MLSVSITTMNTKLSVWMGMNKKYILLIITYLVSLLMCVVAEFYYLDNPDGTFFARSGALIVILGTLINFVDFGNLNTGNKQDIYGRSLEVKTSRCINI